MTIDEAIERLEVFEKDVSEGAPELLDDAINLGIEALTAIKYNRENPCLAPICKLSGETES